MVRKLLHYRPRRKLFLPRREKPLLVGTSYFKLLETSTAARKNSPELSFKFPRKSHANSRQRIIVRLNLLKDASECYEFMLLLWNNLSKLRPVQLMSHESRLRIQATNPGYESTPKARTTTILVHSKLIFTHRRLKTVLLPESKKCEECFAQNEEISYPMDERETIVLEKRLHAAVPDRAVLFCQSKMSNM